MRNIFLALAAAAAFLPTNASAQFPHFVQRGAPPPQPGPLGRPPLPGPPGAPLFGIDAERADFLARSGSANVYFGSGSTILGAPAKATLGAQAQWLLAHPDIVVRIEGYGDPRDTRDHALAVGAGRADAVRDYLVLLGVPALQLSDVSFGEERPGPGRAVTVLVR
ncbi:MAG: OmpA family protein [Sphingomonas sp.]|nr:OmpA family protein [Sphingomonas sp.]